MAYPVFSIGAQAFLKMNLPADRKNASNYESFWGVNDYTIWKDAQRGEMQQIQTVTDFETVDDAETALRAYEALQGGDRQAVVWNDNTQTFDVFVDKVTGRIKPLALGVGGLTGDAGNSAGALLYAQWTVLAVPKA